MFRAQKSLDEYKDRLSAPVVSSIQSHIDGLKKALEGHDEAHIKAKTAELNKEMQKIGEELAKSGSANPQQGAPGASDQKGSAETVEEADVEIVDEDKK
jgi:molecular chaperone DnaK